MSGLHALRRLTPAAAIGVGVAVVLSAGVADAATGGHLILGKANSAGAPTSLSNTGSGAALKLHTKSGTTPNLTVSNGTKVARLNADRLDSLDSSAFVRVVTRNLALAPQAGTPTPVTLVAITGVGTFSVDCSSDGEEADILFHRSSAISSINLVTSRLYDPPGGGS